MNSPNPEHRACARIVGRLSAFLDGESTDAASRGIRAHLPRCADCSRALATLVSLADATDRARAGQRADKRDAAAKRRFERFAAVRGRWSSRTVEVVPQHARIKAKPERRSARTPRAGRRGSRSK